MKYKRVATATFEIASLAHRKNKFLRELNRNYKIFTGIAVLFFAVFPMHASIAQTVDSTLVQALQLQIQQLFSQIQSLQQQVTDLKTELGVSAQPAVLPTESAPFASTDEKLVLPTQTLPPELSFTRTLVPGTRGDDVRAVQEYLAQDPAIYPDGLITGYFGPLTQKAIQRFQTKHGIVNLGALETTGYGVLGPLTRTKLRELVTSGFGASGIKPSALFASPSVVPTVPTFTVPAAGFYTFPKSGATCATEKLCQDYCISYSPAYNDEVAICEQFFPGVAACGNGVCDSAESRLSCPADCAIAAPQAATAATTTAATTTVSATTTATVAVTVTPEEPSVPLNTATPTPTPTTTIPPAPTATLPPMVVTSNTQVIDITSSSAVVIWMTDVDASSKLKYATSPIASAGTILEQMDTAMKNHRMNLSSLSAGQTYYFTITSTDMSGNTATSGERTFTTTMVVTPPVISSVDAVNMTDTSATIGWYTDQSATGVVYYASSESALDASPSQAAQSGNSAYHQVPLSGLARGTTYYYRVVSSVSGANPTTSVTKTFTTTAPPIKVRISWTIRNGSLPTLNGVYVSAKVDGSPYWSAAGYTSATPNPYEVVYVYELSTGSHTAETTVTNNAGTSVNTLLFDISASGTVSVINSTFTGDSSAVQVVPINNSVSVTSSASNLASVLEAFRGVLEQLQRALQFSN